MPEPEVGTTRAPDSEPAADLRPAGEPQRSRTAAGAGDASPSASEQSEPMVWIPHGQGEIPWHEISDIRLTDSLVARINLSNGNLMLAATDFDVAGVGQNLQLTRTHNSVDHPFGLVSDRWWQGWERTLDTLFDDPIWYDETGATIEFERDEQGGFTTPDGYGVDLVENSDGTFTLTDRATGTKDTYDTDGTLTRVTDRNHGTITVEPLGTWGRDGFVLTEERSGRSLELTRAGDRRWEARDHTGREAVYELDREGNITATTDTAGATTGFDHDDNGRVTAVTTPEGRVTTFTYDNRSRITSMTRVTGLHGEGPTHTYAYSAEWPGEAGTTTVTDPLGHETTYRHNDDGEVEEVTDPLGKTRSRTYEAHMVTTATDAMGTGQDDPGNVTAYGWDARNNLTSSQLPTGATLALTGYQTIAGADVPGTITMPDGQSTDFEYDTAGNTLSVAATGPEGGTRTYTYNSAYPECGGFEGQRCTATDANGATTHFTYDDHTGDLIEAAPPEPIGATTYSHDDLGRPTTVTDGRGITLTHTYDDRDRITAVTGPDTAVEYRYDADGNITRRTDAAGTTTYTFDALSRETIRTLPNGSQTVLTYTADGNLATYTDPAGTAEYTWDEADRLTTLTDPRGAETTYDYNNNDTRTATHYPTGVTQHVEPDASNRPVRITAEADTTTLIDLTYTYSRTTNGQTTDGTKIRTRTDQTTGHRTTYTYDSAGRLSRAVEHTGDEEHIETWQYRTPPTVPCASPPKPTPPP
ncbi:hypothetical protein FNX48_019670 [Streptomyces sp. IF17]|nr:hypothetical protein [Streptomyces alkaliphilus]